MPKESRYVLTEKGQKLASSLRIVSSVDVEDLCRRLREKRSKKTRKRRVVVQMFTKNLKFAACFQLNGFLINALS
jgi:hypothetical protein